MVLASLAAASLIFCGSAAAQNVPPGVSGVNQYTETLPGPGGNGAAGGGHSGGSSQSPAQTLGATNARKLEALGPEGKAAAQLAAAEAPETAGSSARRKSPAGHKSHDGGTESSGSPRGDSSGSSGVQQVLGQITGTGGSDSGGMNWLLPLLIGATVVLAAAFLLNRRRPAQPQD